jgi:hypothetical protein
MHDVTFNNFVVTYGCIRYFLPCQLQQIMPEPDTAVVWVAQDGNILSACPTFTDWFAYTAKVWVLRI